MMLFSEMEIAILKLIRSHKEPQIAETILKKKRRVRGSHLLTERLPQSPARRWRQDPHADRRGEGAWK